jgi:hypothetical protein
MSRWMIDDLGGIRPANAAALATVLGVSSPISDVDANRLEDYGILNVGLIIAEARRETIAVKCRPAVLTDRAIATLDYWLLERPRVPVAISWYNGTWEHERAPAARTAVSFVTYLSELRGRPPLPAERIRAQPSLQAARTWQRLKAEAAMLTTGRMTEERYGRVLNPIFHGRWTVFDVATGTAKIEVVASGNGYPCLDPAFTPSQGRERFEMLADRGYRDWVTAGYLDVARSGRSRFEDVDAIVEWPRLGDLRTKYWRIVVPLHATGERCLILSASGNDSGIDLRPQPVEEVG